MEVDIEELAKLLYPNGLPSNLVDNEEFSKYIVQLASCGVEKLARESGHLTEEKKSLLEGTVELVYSNYKTFIHTAECSKSIFRQFFSIEDHLEGLFLGLPILKQTMNSFLATSRNLSNSRHLTSLTLQKHSNLLEILELPQLMDTCVRNGYYEDALQILSYSKRLEKKHTNIPLIASLVRDVQGCQRLMLSQLLNQLRSSLTLPRCLKIVGLLRRLDLFSEAELRLKFLQSRDSWFTALINAVIRDDPYVHISKVIETSRVHLFDIVTQYRAIFSDEDSRFNISDDINEEAIFQGWIVHKVEEFLEMLEIDLCENVSVCSNMESILAQSMFFGQSFGRIGADFRPSLIPIFKKASLLHFKNDVRKANLKFDESFSSFSLMDIQKVHPLNTKDEMSPSSPPLLLMEFPPLAHYLNGIINAFTNLRFCCPISLINQVVDVLNPSLSKIVSSIIDLHRLESSGFTDSEKKSFEKMCTLLNDSLISHINICLRALFPLQMVMQITGRPLAILQKQKYGQLKKEDLISPLQQFLLRSQLDIAEGESTISDIPESTDTAEKLDDPKATEKVSTNELVEESSNENSEEKVDANEEREKVNSEEIESVGIL